MSKAPPCWAFPLQFPDLLPFQTEVLADVLRKSVVNLGMPGYRLFLPSARICVDVVPSAASEEDTTVPEKLPDERSPLHTAISLVAY